MKIQTKFIIIVAKVINSPAMGGLEQNDLSAKGGTLQLLDFVAEFSSARQDRVFNNIYMTRNFTCPYCNRPTTITDPNYFEHFVVIKIKESNMGDVGLKIIAITCPNIDCNKLFLKVDLSEAVHEYADVYGVGEILENWRLLPESEARTLPDYIPEAIRKDYYEACRIRDLSSKASATLARRCLQGMIRNYWAIKRERLQDEINDLEDKVDLDTWTSINAVRSVGNIGAHMERDINIIVDVEPGEAQLLIGLIEQLIDDWYVVRENRRKRTEELKNLVFSKEKQKNVSTEND
ncbi:MAG: DUF4145 domain-containing protein [Patescibacteria group bacterium]